jgi:hypothetical protein
VNPERTLAFWKGLDLSKEPLPADADVNDVTVRVAKIDVQVIMGCSANSSWDIGGGG